MATMDVFKADAFQMSSLTDAVNLIEFKPQFLGTLGLFRPMPVRTTTVQVEQREETLGLVPFSERGAPAAERAYGAREVRNFLTRRLREGSTLQASEVQDIRAFGIESELMQVMTEVNRRQALLVDDIELTWENQRLGVIQGLLPDADGSTVINYFTEFGIAQPAEIAFDLANTAEGDLRGKVAVNVTRPIRQASKGLVAPGDRIYALCGDDFFDEFINHAEVRDVIKRDPNRMQLLDDFSFEQIDLFGVRWVNYRGTDDNTTVGIGTDLVKFFPASPRVFEVAWGPAESFEAVNAPGMPMFSQMITDQQRNEWVRVEVSSYPLFLCKRPQVLLRGKRGA